MSTITHVFYAHQRIEHGKTTSTDVVPRRAFFEYDVTGTNVVISIIPTLSPKKAHLVRQDGFTLYYQGDNRDYRFEIECWPDNGSIKRFSVFRDDTGIEYRFISDHQDAL